MKLNILTIHEQCVAISCCTRALQDLYEDLDTIVATRKIGLPYVIKMLNEQIREANRILEQELDPLMDTMSVHNPTVEISIGAGERVKKKWASGLFL